MDTLLKQATEAFSNWLGSPAGHTILLKQVRHSCNDSNLLSHDNSLMFSSPTSPSPTEKEELIQETAHDFILFVFESFMPALSAQPEQCDNVLNGRYIQLLNFAWNGFVWQVKEKGRSKQYNERGYLYRRARQVISKARQFVCLRLKDKPFSYRPAELAGAEHGIWSDQGESFTSWSPPATNPGKEKAKTLFSTSYLIATGKGFYTQARDRAQLQPLHFFMPVKEFVRYLAAHFPWINRPGFETVEENTVASDANAVTPDVQAEILHGLSAMPPLAMQLVAGFSDEECAVFVHRSEDPPRSFEDIAATLGYPDHNKAYRQYKKVQKQLMEFCSNWPGEPLSELPEDVALFFLDQVILLAKKRAGVRNSM